VRFRRQITGLTFGKSNYPAYDSADVGFRNYWYPVMFARTLGRGPRPAMVLGEELCFMRDVDGKVYAVSDRCPHRGIPLSEGSQEFPGTITCPYHGWTYRLSDGEVVAALTDGPDSPVCGKVRVQTYPVAERAGILWVFVGDGPPPPLEEDVPEELLRPDAVVLGRFTVREGDWRHAAENGFDEGHAKFLHRGSAFLFFRRIPAWSRTHVVTDPDGKWITRVTDGVGFETNYPGLGRWPRFRSWNRSGRGPTASIRLPGALRIHYGSWVDFEWYVPTAVGSHRYVQIVVRHARGLRALLFRLWYWLYLRPVFHGQFNDQDTWMVGLMRTPPERLYRPDVSIIAWRKLGELARQTQSHHAPATEPKMDTWESDVPEPTRT
jgi:phenylpropionate dioxygenase-like ring-hydroxylating dioxygenase large terminal subunit